MKKIIFLVILIPISSFSQIINKTLDFDGLNREYIIYLPSNFDNTTSHPVMFNFHGGSDLASNFIFANDMRPIADTAKFIAVYPQGAVDYEGADPGTQPSTSWLHKAPTNHDDIFFIEAIIDDLNNEYLIDQDRIYACGYSEGAIFSYELACRLNHKIAAIGAVSGSMLDDYYRNDIYGWGPCNPSHPTSIMLIPGTLDQNPHSNYNGFSYLDLPLYMSVEEITSYWSNYNNANPIPSVESLEDVNPYDGSTVEQNTWENPDCIKVIELKVIDGDHEWPGTSGNMDINASEEIWNFVSKYDLNGAINCSSSLNLEKSNIMRPKLLKTLNILGQNSNITKNNLVFEIYDDGSVKKRIFLDY